MPRLLVNFRKRHMAESYFASCLVGLIAADNLVEDMDGILYLLASIGFIIGFRLLFTQHGRRSISRL